MQRFIPRSPMRAAAAGGAAAAATATATVQGTFSRSPRFGNRDGQKPAAPSPSPGQKQVVVAGNKRLSSRSFSPMNRVSKSNISPIVMPPDLNATARQSASGVRQPLQRYRGHLQPPAQRPRTTFFLDIKSPDGHSLFTETMRLAMPSPRRRARPPSPQQTMEPESSEAATATPKRSSPAAQSQLNVSANDSVITLNSSDSTDSLNVSNVFNASLNSSTLNASAEGRNAHLDDNITVATVLDAVGFAQYADLFEAAQIEVDQMLALELDDLRALEGFDAADAPKLAAALRRLSAASQPGSPMRGGGEGVSA